MDMETFAGREVDHALAIEPVEAVAHRGDAHPEIVGQTRGLDPGAARPFAGHQPALDRFIGRLEDMRGAHWPLLSASANWATARSEEHTSELQSLMRISYAVFCLKKKTNN